MKLMERIIQERASIILEAEDYRNQQNMRKHTIIRNRLIHDKINPEEFRYANGIAIHREQETVLQDFGRTRKADVLSIIVEGELNDPEVFVELRCPLCNWSYNRTAWHNSSIVRTIASLYNERSNHFQAAACDGDHYDPEHPDDWTFRTEQ